MKNKVSELMDGELVNQDAKKMIEVTMKEKELYSDWETYHLIGDTLRQSTGLSTNLSQRVRQQLIDEPTVLKPENHSTGTSNVKAFAFATAASVFALVSGWLIMQNIYQQPQQPMMMVDRANMQKETERPMAPVQVSHPTAELSFPHKTADDINSYLFFHNFHKEFSPAASTRDQAIHIHPVTEIQNEYGR